MLFTDTTMRDAHQSLLATRMRSFDITRIAQAYSRGLPNLFSLECWGGATFDVAMRFLNEDPWERLAAVREGAPNILTQMLLRGSQRRRLHQLPRQCGEVLRPPGGRRAASTCSASSIASTGSRTCASRSTRWSRPTRWPKAPSATPATCSIPTGPSTTSNTTSALAKELEAAGAHVLGLKDMAGLLKPAAAKKLIETLKQEIGLPIHLHTHDTSGAAAATIMAAVEAGRRRGRCGDGRALAAPPRSRRSARSSRRCTTADRDPELDGKVIREISFYWEAVRTQYRAFESDLKGGASEVYLHEMPGGQFTNLKEQARSLGLESALARGRADLCRRQPDVRRHRQGDAVVQGGRRHGAGHGVGRA